MITLGQASNYSIGQVFRHLFAWGGRHDSEILQEKLAARYDVDPKHVILYHTGRSALTAAIRSVTKGTKCRVIVPGLTCIAVIRAIKAAGCTPVFVDITPATLEYNYEKLESILQTKSSSDTIILVQNTLGISWQISKIETLAKQYSAQIVEDLAHCAGRLYADGREVGTVGATAALSFGKGKAIDTIEGGVAILRTNDLPQAPTARPRLSDRLRDRWYPVFGLISRWNSKLGRYFIGGLVKLHWVQRSADAELDLRSRLTHWQARLATEQLDRLPQTKLRDFRLVEHRSEVLSKLQQSGYFFEEIWYDTPVSPKRYEQEADFPATECPVTVQIADQIINLPTWYPQDKLTKAYEIIKEYEANYE